MNIDREKWARNRIIIIGILFGLLFVAVSGQAFKLQIIQHEDMVKKAERQQQHAVPLTPGRGAIMDCNGNNLAVSVEMQSCYAERRNIADVEGTAAVLAPFLEIPVQDLTKKINGSRNFCWLARRMPPEKALKIKNLKLHGIGFAPETKRFYPNSDIAAHVIGFTGLDPNGLDGIELKYDSVILGNTGYLITERDALGRDIAPKAELVKSSSPGKNVILTLDKNIQYITEKELSKAVISSGAKTGMALVMEPDTGRILALANYPTFNPNADLRRYSSGELRNHVVADSFEPGSTFKTFLIAAALEEKLVKPTDSFNCEHGVYNFAGHTIHDTHSYGRLTVSDILKHSSNIGAAKIGFRLGDERLARYLRNFGFGERSGIDLPGESPGNMRSKQHWYGIDLATISFGQGITATAVQLAAAISAIANGGYLMKPYVVERITDDNGIVIQRFDPQMLRRVISADTSKKVTTMMEGVTNEGGTGTNAAVEGFRVAGKTGTAQKADPVTHRYSASKRTGSFIGFIPADKPRLTILVIIDEPKTSPYGGVVAAPAFHGIALNSLAYLKVVPEKGTLKTAKVVAMKPGQTAPQETMAEGESMDMPESGELMPDFRGMSMRRVMQVMEKRNINIRLMGSGRATEQSPAPGLPIRGVDSVWIKFTPSA